jgi:LysM repeat protein
MSMRFIIFAVLLISACSPQPTQQEQQMLDSLYRNQVAIVEVKIDSTEEQKTLALLKQGTTFNYLKLGNTWVKIPDGEKIKNVKIDEQVIVGTDTFDIITWESYSIFGVNESMSWKTGTTLNTAQFTIVGADLKVDIDGQHVIFSNFPFVKHKVPLLAKQDSTVYEIQKGDNLQKMSKRVGISKETYKKIYGVPTVGQWIKYANTPIK